jgi:hypothetical protein
MYSKHFWDYSVYILISLKVAKLTYGPYVEAGSSTSTVALRVVGGEGKGYNWVTMLLGGYKCGDAALQVGKASNLRE